MRGQVKGEVPEIKAEVLALALEHGLMSKYTAFVAVERTISPNIDLPLDTILIPSELPDGVSYEGNFGPPKISHQRVKPGDPVLTVWAPEEAIAVIAEFPFGLQRRLERDPKSGLWTCRFLVPRSEPEGTYRIAVRIVLPHGDWIETGAEYVVDSTAPSYELRTILDGRTLRFLATPVTGVFERVSSGRRGDARATVVPDVMSVVIRPPQGGYVVLSPRIDPDSSAGWVWEGSYDLPSWYTPGRYTFRFLAIDVARNTFSRDIQVKVPAAQLARGLAQ